MSTDFNNDEILEADKDDDVLQHNVELEDADGILHTLARNNVSQIREFFKRTHPSDTERTRMVAKVTEEMYNNRVRYNVYADAINAYTIMLPMFYIIGVGIGWYFDLDIIQTVCDNKYIRYCLYGILGAFWANPFAKNWAFMSKVKDKIKNYVCFWDTTSYARSTVKKEKK